MNHLLIDYCHYAERGILLDLDKFIPLWIAANDLAVEARSIGYENADDVPLLDCD